MPMKLGYLTAYSSNMSLTISSVEVGCATLSTDFADFTDLTDFTDFTDFSASSLTSWIS